MHIARSFTAIYTIDPHNDIVHVIQILTIERAHRRYGRM